MADIIQLLPDVVANQIAAGEVVQRPASAVKELLENAIDSGATEIKLIIKDAGKTLIQVIDNGCGMSETDARMSFERHATSKIRKAEELFEIRTKGFRGEALASIAAIAQVELRSRLCDREVGTRILIAGNEVEMQEPVSTPAGTSVSVRNLFFNTPARRNFLKSDPVEMKHIIEEFERVALAHPDIGFMVNHNGTELFNFKPSALRQRIVNMFGPKFNERLVPVEEETAIVKVHGFVCKPEYAKKTRGEQYLFVNDRFIKSNFLNHAISSAFDELVSRGSFPTYFIYLQLDPSRIDINIHPTKTEIKFMEERAIYSIIHAAVRNSLGKYNIAPSLDFDQEDSLNIPPPPRKAQILPPERRDYVFNPFESESEGHRARSSGPAHRSGSFPKGWEELYQITERKTETVQIDFEPEEKGDVLDYTQSNRPIFQFQSRFILTTIKSGFIVIDHRRAHERIMYENALRSLDQRKGISQQQLFPQTVELSAADCALVMELRDDLDRLGFTIEPFGGQTIVINGMPDEAAPLNPKAVIENLLEQYKLSVGDVNLPHKEKLARSMARSMVNTTAKSWTREEMIDLVDRLFACEQPQITPTGKPVFIHFDADELNKKFKI